MNEKKADFMGAIAFHIGKVLLSKDDEQAEALAVYTAWLADYCLKYADKINPNEQNEGVVAREGVKVDTGMYDAWNEAKKGPVSTQEEIGDRWKEAEKDG